MKKIQFLVGPTVVPSNVLSKLSLETITHRTEEYRKIYSNLKNNLKKVFGTKEDVLVITSSGTGCMEAALQNCFEKDDELVMPVIGEFSERFVKMANNFGYRNIKVVEFPLGEAVDIDIVMESVSKNTKGIFVIHNESATGVMNDLKRFGQRIKDTNALLVVDSVSGVGGLEMKMDAWGLDIVFTSSQKALMGPPGLGFISLSKKAWKRVESITRNTFYFDLKLAKKFHQINENPWTPAVPLVVATNESLQNIVDIGVERVIERHRENAELLRSELKKLGFRLYPKSEKFASDTVTCIEVPSRGEELVNTLLKHNIVISGGQGHLSKDTVRIGTMGYVFKKDIEELIKVLKTINFGGEENE